MNFDLASFMFGVTFGAAIGALALLGFAVFMTRNERRGQ